MPPAAAKSLQPRLRRVEMHPLLLSAAPYESSDMFPFRRKVVRQYQKGRISIGRSPVMKVFVTKGSAAAAGGTI